MAWALLRMMFQSAELEDKIHHLEADNVALKSQLEESASKVVKALKEGKTKDAELQTLRTKLTEMERQLAELAKTNQELSSSMAKAEGTLQRAATLSGLDDSVRQEFNEVSVFPSCKRTGDSVVRQQAQYVGSNVGRNAITLVGAVLPADERFLPRDFGWDANRIEQGLTTQVAPTLHHSYHCKAVECGVSIACSAL